MGAPQQNAGALCRRESYRLSRQARAVPRRCSLGRLRHSGHHERSLLVGARDAGSKRLFSTAAVGLSRVQWSNGCMGPCESGTTTGVAWDLGAHANAFVPGLAMNVYGVFGPAKSRVFGATLSL